MTDIAGRGDSFEGARKPTAIEVSGYEPDVFAHRHMVVESNQQARWEYDGSGNTIYAGWGARGLATSSYGWLLQKITYVGNNPTVRQIAYDSWDNRVGASYA